MEATGQRATATWTIDDEGPIIDVVVSGELDLASVPTLARELEGRCARRTAAVVCDLTRVGFADSTCVHWLVRLRRTLRAADGVLVVLVAEGGPVERLLRLVADRAPLPVVAEPVAG